VQKFNAAAGSAYVSHDRGGTNMANAGADIDSKVIADDKTAAGFDESAAETN
jgi:hypothetical protein